MTISWFAGTNPRHHRFAYGGRIYGSKAASDSHIPLAESDRFLDDNTEFVLTRLERDNLRSHAIGETEAVTMSLSAIDSALESIPPGTLGDAPALFLHPYQQYDLLADPMAREAIYDTEDGMYLAGGIAIYGRSWIEIDKDNNYYALLLSDAGAWVIKTGSTLD